MEQGLTLKQVQEGLEKFGKNEITATATFSPLALFLSQFPTGINFVLAGAALISFLIADAVDGGLILTILFLNALFGFIQEYRAEKSLQKLKSFITPLSRVIRDGKEQQIATVELVPGDIVILTEGDRVPADGTLSISHHLEVDESILTGESLPVMKKTRDSVFGGTLIVKGKATMQVSKTGQQTQFGQIAKTLATITADKTPLQKQLDTLGKVISVIAVLIALLLIPLGLLQAFSLVPLLLLAVSIGVAAIPEGLPAVITIALAIGTNRMAKKHAIVRQMPAIETLGSVQTILIDKTGTLTQNSMRVKKFWLRKKKDLELLVKACIFGNTASLLEKGDAKTWDIVGDKTDGALLLWANAQHANIDALKKSGKIRDEYTFDQQTKTITTIWESEKKSYVFVRGAPETLLEKSILTEGERKLLSDTFETYAKDGFRVIAVGTKIVNHTNAMHRVEAEKDLSLIGIFGIYDPPRPEAKQAVLAANQAGIHTVMVTGDNPITAVAIAKEIGLIEKDEDVITGTELKTMSDEQVLTVLDKVRVFARTQPEDKLRLVTLYKQKGHVVGVTGDGVNDALALKRADVGIAMGQKGTDVAKEAADIVLTDDNFSSIVKAVEEGRTIYSNIQKSITYLLSGNLSELALIFFAVLFGMPTPLLPTQILWMNIVTDGLPALALASDPKNPSLLHNKPRNPQTPILTRNRVIFIISVGLGFAVILLQLFNFLLAHGYSELFSRTIIFNVLVIFHMFLAFFIRGNQFFRPNIFLIISVCVTLAIQLLITTTPFFQELFHLSFNTKN